jgi:hypothetical protein
MNENRSPKNSDERTYSLSRLGPVLESLPTRLDGLRETVEATAFWTAILLPLAYVPVLYLGLTDPVTVLAFGALVAVHLSALSISHDYGR